MELIDKVVNGGYCIGCGACTAVKDSPYAIKMNDNGCYEAVNTVHEKTDDTDIADACPFYNQNLDEDTLARQVFPETNSYDNKIGSYDSIHAGRVVEGEYFTNGSSGGVAKWILATLLENDYVDYVVQVYNNEDNTDKLFEYRVVSEKDEILKGAKSVYYPVEMSGVLQFIKENPGRYAITGVPCFVKSIRILQNKEKVFAERIKFCIGIVCGHLKSSFYSQMIAWQKDVKPSELSYIDFRLKIEGKGAKEKGIKVKSVSGKEPRPDIVQNIYGTNYGEGFFMNSACDFCDDVVAETADVAIGDAWLPQFLEKGTSLIIVRNPVISKLLSEAGNKLNLTATTNKEAFDSQRGGFRHRREGLAYRLYLKEKQKQWHPPKRVMPNQKHLDKAGKQKFKQRIKIAEASYIHFKKSKALDDFEYFKDKMQVETQIYKDLYRPQISKKLQFKMFVVKLMKSAGLHSLYRKIKTDSIK